MGRNSTAAGASRLARGPDAVAGGVAAQPWPPAPGDPPSIVVGRSIAAAAVGALGGVLAGRGVVSAPIALLCVAAVGAAATVAAAVDLHRHRLPNRLSLAVLVAGSGASVSEAVRVNDSSLAAVSSGLTVVIVGVLVGGLPLLAVRVTRGLGMGDVKLAGALGASSAIGGWWVPAVAVALASLGAAAYGAARRQASLAFGPFLAGGWSLSLFVSPSMTEIWG